MKMKMNKLFIVSGPSGSGKDTILKELKKDTENYFVSISMTTRQPRENDGVLEVDGKDYYFVTTEKFEELIREDKMLEYAEYCGKYYGTPLEPLVNAQNEGKVVILEIEIDGMRKVRDKLPEVETIFITIPSVEVLEKRLRKRGKYSDEEINKRLSKARKELEYITEYKHVIVNDELEKAVAELKNILTNGGNK